MEGALGSSCWAPPPPASPAPQTQVGNHSHKGTKSQWLQHAGQHSRAAQGLSRFCVKTQFARWHENHVLFNSKRRGERKILLPLTSSIQDKKKKKAEQIKIYPTISPILTLGKKIHESKTVIWFSLREQQRSRVLLCSLILHRHQVLALQKGRENGKGKLLLAPVGNWQKSCVMIRTIFVALYYFVSTGTKGGEAGSSRVLFLPWDMNTRLACVSAACVDAFVGEIWPEVFLERNLVTLSNHIYSIRSSYSCQMEVCSMGDLWWANSHAWGLGIWGRFWARYLLTPRNSLLSVPAFGIQLQSHWCDVVEDWRDCWPLMLLLLGWCLLKSEPLQW